MKAFLAIVSGFVLTLFVFAGGAITAAYLFTAKPGSADLDLADALPVQSAEASAPREVTVASADDDAPLMFVDDAGPVRTTPIDTTATASISMEAPMVAEPESQAGYSEEHLAWCSNRYRSYRAEDNSFRPYGGGRRECVSPFTGNAAFDGQGDVQDDGWSVDEGQSPYSQASASGYPDPAHIRACFQRYRSYRVEDNSYQPYNGGPRRQCR